jgi:hypothetical protein
VPTSLHIVHTYPASPAQVHTLLTDRSFLEGRMESVGGLDPKIMDLSTEDTKTTVVTRQSIPSSALPSMVASMISGDPVTERTEVWDQDGDGYQASISVVVKGAPAKLTGTITLRPKDDGSEMVVDGSAAVPIPLFGSKVESIIVEQIRALLDEEAEYTARKLG